jgi:hypothetical protein
MKTYLKAKANHYKEKELQRSKTTHFFLIYLPTMTCSCALVNYHLLEVHLQASSVTFTFLQMEYPNNFVFMMMQENLEILFISNQMT